MPGWRRGGDDGVGTKAPHDEPSRDLHGGDRCQGRDGNTQALDQLHVSVASAIPLIQDSVTQEGNILVQFLHSVCRPGKREKLRYSQAELGPAIKSAVAYFASISGVANGMQEL